ncbi:unnamed protein product [Parajaminaea phylloscopi]
MSSIKSSATTASPESNPFPPAAASPSLAARDDGSSYSTHTLRTLREADGGSIGSDEEEDGRRVIHVLGGDRSGDGSAAQANGSPGSSPAWQTPLDRRRIVIRAFSQLAIFFVVCALILGGTLYLALPEIDEADRPAFRIPKNFDQLKGLNEVLQRYKEENFARVMLCWVVVYMFLQAFSIPGSMYMSILAGAMWGVPLALPIVCASVATGATICYLISKFLGEVLHAIPSWKARVDSWKAVLDRQRDDMLSYLIVIRMMPVPPHNVVNILAPHLGIGLPMFWFSTFCGIFAVSVIHTTIGEKLDQMASPADFNLFTWRNALLLGGVCVAVLVPVALRKRSAAAHNPLEDSDAPQTGSVRLEDDNGGPWSGQTNQRRSLVSMGRNGRPRRHDDSDDDDELPPVRMRGAIAGFSRQSARSDGEGDDLLDDVDEDAADVDFDRTDGFHSRRGSASGGEDDASSLRGFRDRHEHGRPAWRRSGANGTAASRGADYEPVGPTSKAAKILGLSGRGRNDLLPTTSQRTGASSQGQRAGVVDSVTGGISSLWGRLSGGH